MKNNEVLSLYRDVGLIDRIHMSIRFKRCPFDLLEQYLPKSGKILDFGCGHGLFANLIALKSEKRYVIGIDLSLNKIEIAKKSLGGRSNIKFIQAQFDDINDKDFSAITMIDVLYLLPFNEQKRILTSCRSSLKKEGILVIKEVSSSNAIRFRVAYLQEVLMVRIFKRTLGSNFYFRSLDEWTNLFQETGYRNELIKLNTPMQSYLFVCRLM